MKRALLVFAVLIVMVAAFSIYTDTTLAFHDGGVAECSGCHKMHNAPGTDLLVASDQSSTCLSCHEGSSQRSYRISTTAPAAPNDPNYTPVQQTPGGDFGWIRIDRSATASYGAPLSFPGAENGHNIVALDNAYVADSGNAPGGSMPAVQLACTSCHDPHSRARVGETYAVTYPAVGLTHDPIVDSGSYGALPGPGEAVGAYRLLGGAAYTAWDAVNFPGNPFAVAPSSYNRSEASTTTRVAYGYSPTASGRTSWGLWCATCHPNYHQDAAGVRNHATDETLEADFNGQGAWENYNYYVKTGDLTGVFPRGGPYTSLVPYATGNFDLTVLAPLAQTDDSRLDGASDTDRLACLTCHRAHASPWKYALRWNGEAEFLTLGGPGTPVYPGTDYDGDGDGTADNNGQFNRGYTTAQMEAAYYGRLANREFAAHQRSLCNKCHIQD